MFKFHFKRGLIFAVLGLAVGGVIAALTPKVYEASAELLLGEVQASNATSTLTPDVQRILGVGQATDAQTELQVLRSQSIYFQALRSVAQSKNQPDLLQDFVRYFLMYDVLTPEVRAGAEVRGSVATIRVRANDKLIAEEITREITEVYNEFRTTNARNGLQNAIRYLSAQEVASKKVLDEAEAKYKAYATENGIVSIEATNATATQLEGNAMTRLLEANALAESARAEVASLQQEISGVAREIDSGEFKGRSQTVTQLESQLASARSELERLRSRYYEDHPKVIEVATMVRKMMADLKSENPEKLTATQSGTTPNPVYQALQQQLASARARSEGAQQQVQEAESFMETVKARLRTLPTNEAQIRQLARDQVLADQNFRRVKIQLDDLRTRQDNIGQVAPVLAPARAFENAVAPDVSKFLFIGTIAGLCLGLIYSFAVEAMKLRVHTSHQLADLTGLPVVATIPALSKSQQRRLTSYAAAGAKPGESFRHMAYTFLAKDHSFPRTIMVTGVGSVPGRTTSALQFAMAIAAGGKRVVLVDCDPHRSLATRAFEAEGKAGLSDLFDRGSLPGGDSLLVQTAHDKLSLLPVGSDVTRGIADRTQEQLTGAFAFLKANADVIVLDAPPCDMFADASRLASEVDEVCMVVSASTTNYAQIPNGYELLTRAGAKEVSLILTDASPSEEAFTGSKGYTKGA